MSIAAGELLQAPMHNDFHPSGGCKAFAPLANRNCATQVEGADALIMPAVGSVLGASCFAIRRRRVKRRRRRPPPHGRRHLWGNACTTSCGRTSGGMLRDGHQRRRTQRKLGPGGGWLAFTLEGIDGAAEGGSNVGDRARG